MNYRHYLIALALSGIFAPRVANADVLGDQILAGDKTERRGKPFVALLCDATHAQRLSDDAMQLGISSPGDLIAAMRALWCTVDADDERRLKAIEQRVSIPFSVQLTGHDQTVQRLGDLQRQLGSLSFGELPEELDVEVLEGGSLIVFKRAENLDSWQMRLSRGKWQLQRASLCECED